jgi:hypothetical protein
VRPRVSAIARVLLALLTAGDLAWATYRLKRSLPPADDLRAEASVVRVLRDARLFDPSGVPPRIAVPYWIVRDNGGLLYGYSTFTGYVALTLDRVWVYLHAALDIPPLDIENTYPSARIYDYGPFPYRTMNLRLGLDPRTSALVVEAKPDPRAWVVAERRLVSDWREAVGLMKAGYDTRVGALLEEPARELEAPPPHGLLATARIVRFEPERVEVVTQSSVEGLLVLAEAWYPGWSATVDGVPRPCLPANAWMRAVPVPAGEARVVLTYWSRPLGWGAALSVAAVAVGVLSLRRVAKRQEPGA